MHCLSRRNSIALALPALGAMLASCTVIHVADGRPVSARFGVLTIVPDDRTGLIAYRSTGLGLVPGLRGATVGFQREATVVVRDGSACQVIVFELPDGAEAAALWRDMIARNPNICIREGEIR